jgi:PAS domain S-box-containing protein
MQVLYVEDNSSDADLTQRSLSKNAGDIHLQIVTNQFDAIHLLSQKNEFDLLLTDFRLPDGNGLSLLRYVRQNKLPLAVVVLTGQGDKEIAIALLKAGANDYLVKQANYIQQLPAILAKALQDQKSSAALPGTLNVLYVEQNQADIVLTLPYFTTHAAHIHLDIAKSGAEALQILSEKAQDFHAVLLDNSLSDKTAIEILTELRRILKISLPVLLLSRQGSDEEAAEAFRLGADDYIVKDEGYLYRLPGLLENAYHRTRLIHEQKALLESEERYHRLADNATDIIFRLGIKPVFKVEYLNQAVETLTGYTPLELYQNPQILLPLFERGDLARLKTLPFENLYSISPITLQLNSKDGSAIWLETRLVPVLDKENQLVGFEGISRDITERKLTEEKLQTQLQRLNAIYTFEKAIISCFDPRIILSILLDHVTHQLGVHAASIYLINKPTRMLQFADGKGFRTNYIFNTHIYLGESYAGHAAIERRTIQLEVEDIPGIENPRFKTLCSLEGVKSYCVTPLVAKGEVKGVLEIFNRTPLVPDPDWLAFFEMLADQAAIAIDNTELFENLQRSTINLTLAYDSTLEGWARALDIHDKATEGHTQRVTELTMHLASLLSLDNESLVNIRRGALLHDMGNLAIPDSILLKPGPLDPEEWEILRKHPLIAKEMLSSIAILRNSLDIPVYHHEKWNGSGYPYGLKGEQIPLAARIFAIVDVWDALNSDRPYRPKFEKSRAVEHILAQKGIHFDPHIVDIFRESILSQEK